MYLVVSRIVGKCTEKKEGVAIYKIIRPTLKKNKLVQLDMEGIMNVTDEFLTGLFGSVIHKYGLQAAKSIQYVRVKSYIKTRTKSYLDCKGRAADL